MKIGKLAKNKGFRNVKSRPGSMSFHEYHFDPVLISTQYQLEQDDENGFPLTVPGRFITMDHEGRRG